MSGDDLSKAPAAPSSEGAPESTIPTSATASRVFQPVRSELDFPADEGRILAFWKESQIFERTLRAETRATGPSKGTFVFYEGPPTANGMPHNGHVLTRAVKDVFPRYKTMLGYDVPRKAGWDTHGLPVEVEVEKELRIHGKADIEKYGVEAFISRCVDSVFRYTDAWEKLTDKIGFWVDLDQAYVTYHKSYVESVWWALSELHKKGLLYRGHRVCWWWPQGGTALSAAEVGWNYKTVDDPSAFVAFPLVDEPDVALCAWTTTPWTLPSNGYAAVRAEFDYVVVDPGEGMKKLIVAAGLREDLAKKLKRDLPVVRTLKGKDLEGKRYRPPFETYAASLFDRTAKRKDGSEAPLYWRVILADFVTLDAGTGIVHVAPAFGEDDFEAHRAELARDVDPLAVPLLCAVRPDGTFGDEMGDLAGVWVKDADARLLKDLAARGLLVHEEKYRHDYPFCWRADDDPLLQLARPAWYIRTTALIDRAIANNQAVNWLPDHIKSGRFGDFLANNVDWALSRERYWGTPLNVWVCDKNEEHQLAPSSVAEIEKLKPGAFDHFHEAKKANPSLNDHLIVHKPWIDAVTFPCSFNDGGSPGKPGSAPKPPCGGTMKRVTEVIDAWFDSGSMPFAQWGYPHKEGSKEIFEKAFPADFISEAIDQTRGWFYSLLMISTMVFEEEAQKRLGLATVRPFPHPYKTCVVLGHVCDREGKKESKSKGNYTPPEVILSRVRMEFAAVDVGATKVATKGADAAYIAREDFEGLDFSGESAVVELYRSDREQEKVRFTLHPAKGLPRRIVAMSAEMLERLGLKPSAGALEVPPNDVPRLPQEERVFIEDPATPAPGADAFRWFFYASSPSWTNTRHSLTNVRGSQKEFAVKLRNVYSFFVIYASIDGFSPADGNFFAKDTTPAALAKSWGYRPARERSLLDRWMLSELALATRDVRAALDNYLLFDAAARLVDLVDALSNWYVRRSRARFWAPAEAVPFDEADTVVDPSTDPILGGASDKRDAYFTLYEVLVAIAKLIAPFTPFLAEEMFQNLVRGPWPASQPQSVHLTAYPEPDEGAIDEALAVEMRAVRELVSLGLQVRTANKLKVRQPLSRADVVVSSAAIREAIQSHAALIVDELNVHEVRFLKPGEEGKAVRYVLKPNFRALGPKLGKKVQLAKQALAKADAADLRARLASEGKVSISLEGEEVTLGPEEIEVTVEASEGFAAAGGRAGVVVLHTALTDELRDEGLFREILSRVQGARKEMSLGFTERIELYVDGSDRVKKVIEASRDALMSEALATRLVVGSAPEGAAAETRRVSVDGEELAMGVVRLGKEKAGGP
jgi:isoleucyl-tRNA synthetase